MIGYLLILVFLADIMTAILWCADFAKRGIFPVDPSVSLPWIQRASFYPGLGWRLRSWGPGSLSTGFDGTLYQTLCLFYDMLFWPYMLGVIYHEYTKEFRVNV